MNLRHYHDTYTVSRESLVTPYVVYVVLARSVYVIKLLLAAHSLQICVSELLALPAHGS